MAVLQLFGFVSNQLVGNFSQLDGFGSETVDKLVGESVKNEMKTNTEHSNAVVSL